MKSIKLAIQNLFKNLFKITLLFQYLLNVKLEVKKGVAYIKSKCTCAKFIFS